MKSLTQTQIKEIAENLDCGMKCYLNIETNQLLFYPEMLDFDDEDHAQYWENEVEEMTTNFSSYQEIEKPNSAKSFTIMEDFADSHPLDPAFRIKLKTVLELKKPFANFKICIDQSDYRNDWFEFKNNWMQNWVQSQLKRYLKDEA